MPERKQVIMYDAPEAASIQTVTGWVSADGRLFSKDEDLARFCGATHRRCKHNADHPVDEICSYCVQCHAEHRDQVYAAMPTKEWAGEPLVDFDSDNYFSDADSLRDYLIDSDVSLQDLRLCICEPNMPRATHRTCSAKTCPRMARLEMTR